MRFLPSLQSLVPRFVRSSFRAKLFLAVMLPATLAVVDTSQYIGRLWWRLELQEVRDLMFATVIQMAHGLDPDELARLAASDDILSEPAFDKIRSELLNRRRVIVDAVDRDQNEGDSTADDVVIDLYILAATEDLGFGRFVVTTHLEEAGRRYDMRRFPVMMEAWTRPVVEKRPYKDEYGTTLSAYAPIFNEEGEAIAILGMDADAGYFTLIIVKILVLVTLMLIAAMLFSVLCAWWLSRILSRSLGRLTTGMQLVSAGDLETRIEPSGSSDEFDSIFHDFNRMVDGLRTRQEIERQLSDAGAIQTGLLPSLAPSVPGYDIAGGIRYCQHAGGDYYDYLPIQAPEGGERWGITVGDVTGHGVASALMMCSCRAALRSASVRCRGEIPSMLVEVNTALSEDSPGGAFMTMFLGVLDTSSGALRWSSAGHDPGLLIKAGDASDVRLPSTDIPLGIDPARTFDEGSGVALEPGDTLVIGTDGVTQARDKKGEFFGFDRIVEIVRSMPDSSASEIRDRIFEDSMAYTGQSQLEDDATLVVVKRLPASSVEH